jgi:hypothetical protein
MDKFTQLKKDIINGDLNLTHIQIAIRTAYRDSDLLPDATKDILCGKGDSYPGLILQTFNLIKNIIGSTELAYLRGKQEDGNNNNK